MSQPKSDELEKKSRELTERERVLNARENLLEREKALEQRQKIFTEAETKLDVLKKQIKAHEDILSAKQIELESIIAKTDEARTKLEAQKTTALKAGDAQNDILKGLKQQEVQLSATLQEKKTELAEVRVLVKDSKDYLKEQEIITTETINEWNATLVDFRQEADHIQAEKNKLSTDIIRLEQDRLTFETENGKIEAKLDVLDQTYEQKAEEYRGKLKEFDVKVAGKKNELDELNNVIAMKQRDLEVREKSLKLKENDLTRKNAELDQKERRLRMNYGMADMDFSV